MTTVGSLAYLLRCKVSVARARRTGAPLQLAHGIRHLGDAYTYAGRL